MKPIERIIIHCSATPNGDDLFRGKFGDTNFQAPVARIDEWHRARGFKREMAWRRRQNSSLTSIGYHFVIYLDGTVDTGRHVDEMGASVKGWNDGSIAICMLGTDRFTHEQWASLSKLVDGLKVMYAKTLRRICGHRDLSPDKNGDGKITSVDWLKTCPGFSVEAWLRDRPLIPVYNLYPAPTTDTKAKALTK